jgi:hypothetical protein
LFCVGFFRDRVSQNYLPGLALNRNPPELCLLRSWDHGHGRTTVVSIRHDS